MLDSEIQRQFEKVRCILEDRYKFYIRNTLNSLCRKYGSRMEGVYNGRDAALWRKDILPCCKMADGMYCTDPAVLDRNASNFATSAIQCLSERAGRLGGEFFTKKVMHVEDLAFEILGSFRGMSAIVRVEVSEQSNRDGSISFRYPSKIWIGGELITSETLARLLAEGNSR